MSGGGRGKPPHIAAISGRCTLQRAGRGFSFGGVVQYYRIYLLNESDRIVSVTTAECASDVEVIERALQVVGHSADAEIWEGGRLLGKLSQLLKQQTDSAAAGVE